MKRFKRVMIILVSVILVLLAGLVLFLDSIVKTAVNKVAPQLMGVPVSLTNADFSLLRGEVKLEGLVIGNPEGFKTPYAMKLGKLEVDIKTSSLFSKKIVIRKVHVIGPEITYERGLTDSNLSALLKQLEGETRPAEGNEPEAEKEKKAGKKVQIDDFLLDDAKVNLSITGLGGNALPVPLPAIHLTDIGKAEGGATVVEVIRLILSAVVSSVTDVVAGSIKLIGKGVAATGDLALDGVEKAGEIGMKGVEAVGDTAKKGAEVIAGGAGKIVDGVGSLLGLGDEDSEKAGKQNNKETKTGGAQEKPVETKDAAENAGK